MTVSQKERTTFRPDIQGLRTIAVVLVLTTHAFPSALAGGFLGVDIFFVLSGYLITGILWDDLNRFGRIRLSRFYARRAGRLLPLAIVVLLATGVMVYTVMPPFMREFVGTHLAASGLYVQNWALIAESSSYAARDQGASPFQHYWTLSVEEQFYIVLPVALLVAWRFGSKVWATGIIVFFTAASAGFAMAWSPENHEVSYFNTLTRAWEFGVGALAAVFGIRVRRHRGIAQVLGLALMGASVLTVQDTSTTPGPTTVMLVVGTALLLVSGKTMNEESTPIDKVLTLGPMQYVGNISYGLYLWHWPVLIFAQEVLPVEGAWVGWIGLFVSFALAAASLPGERWARRLVAHRATNPAHSLRLGTVLVASTVVLALGAGLALGRTAPSPVASPTSPNESSTMSGAPSALAYENCVGAAAMLPGADCTTSDSVDPDPASARQDMPYEECKESLNGTEVIKCTLGDGPRQVAVVGDSHAQRLVPALEIIAENDGWTLTTYLKSSCPFSAATPVNYASSCSEWNSAVIDELVATEYDVIVVNSAAGVQFHADRGLDSLTTGAEGMVNHWSRLQESGSEVVAIRDNPQPGFARMDPPACVLRSGPEECDAPEDQALLDDPQVTAVEELEGPARLIDLTPMYCRDGTCPSVIGGKLVYRDGQHLHSAYVMTLVPALREELSSLE